SVPAGVTHGARARRSGVPAAGSATRAQRPGLLPVLPGHALGRRLGRGGSAARGRSGIRRVPVTARGRWMLVCRRRAIGCLSPCPVAGQATVLFTLIAHGASVSLRAPGIAGSGFFASPDPSSGPAPRGTAPPPPELHRREQLLRNRPPSPGRCRPDQDGA